MRIGTCQNLIRGQREDWVDSQHCGAPTIDLGIPSERNICQQCRQHSRHFIEGVIRQWAETLPDRARWAETASTLIDDMSARIAGMRASRAPLSKVYLAQQDLDRRVALYQLVTSQGE